MNRRLVATALSLLSLLALRRKLKKKRGVHNIRKLRRKRGAFYTLWRELKNDPIELKKYIRMSLNAFEKLLEVLKPSLVRNSVREPVCPEQRLVVALRYLATGNSFTSIAFSFFLGESTVRAIVHETCEAIRDVLAPMYLRTPTTQAEWKAVADEFYAKWQMPNCLGAVDGKHIMMRVPPNSGSLYFNYKGRFSTVLMAVADAGYRILYASVGSYGHESDGGIFDRSDLGKSIKNDSNPLELPGLAALPGSRLMCIHYFVGDDAFPHHKHLMKPFRQNGLTKERRIYNYRLSRARRMIESTFGLLASKWRLLLRNIDTTPEHCDALVQAVCSLHNYLVDEGEIFTGPGAEIDEVDAELPQATHLRNAHANHAGSLADMTRRHCSSILTLKVPWSGKTNMRFTDDFRRRIILEIRNSKSKTGRIIWDPSEPNFNAYGSRSYAFAGVAHRLSSADIALEIRRMWHKWAVSFYNYKLRKVKRRPKFYYDLHFLNGLTMDHLSSAANRF
ncbi:nuclease HARBI1-like protein [Aphelenchoides avenae]|nr:nuclease HARBI1-like protein [Aphelenchus avenae]KAH7717615.1 nuclease HARBI1-like protein [Aphelenchus avenae]